MSPPQPERRRASSTRTCVGCRAHDDACATVRMVVAESEVAFDLAGGAFGRGAHVHPRVDCLVRAPRGLARAFPGTVRERDITPRDLGARLIAACDRRMTGLLLAARRIGALAVGTNAVEGALRRGSDRILVIVAVDAGSVASSREVQAAIAGGFAVAWRAKSELGGLLGEESVAICAACHAGIAAELKALRTMADAGVAMMGEGTGCSRRREAR
jgi:predicted RNA-binding protein YlxR (DUF448 family)/ribosomal protein L7Ae-like RNA K-turn-binding protein